MTLPAGTERPERRSPWTRAIRARLYLAAWGVATPGGDTGGGIFLSTDAGRDLDATCCRSSQHVYDVTIDPKDPPILYACRLRPGRPIARRDRGETWTRIRGFNFKWGHRVDPRPRGRDAGRT